MAHAKMQNRLSYIKFGHILPEQLSRVIETLETDVNKLDTRKNRIFWHHF